MLATTLQMLTLAAATLALWFSAIVATGAWLAVAQGVNADELLRAGDWNSSLAHDRSAGAFEAAREATENGCLAYEAASTAGAEGCNDYE